MAADIFLYLDPPRGASGDVNGESSTQGLLNWIEITSYDLSTTQPVEGSRSTSGSATSGRADHEDVGFAKQMDKSTPGLLACCCAGDIIPTGEIAHYAMVNNQKVLFACFTMSDIVITEVSLSGSDGVPEETLKLSYGGISWIYNQINHITGARGSDIPKSWDVINNKANAARATSRKAPPTIPGT